MFTKRYFFSLVGAIGLGAGIHAYIAHETLRSTTRGPTPGEPRESDQAPNENSDSLERLHSRVEALANELTILRQQHVTPVLAEASSVTPTAPSPPSRRNPEDVARHREVLHEQMADVEAEFRGERRDPIWATTAESTIAEATAKNELIGGTSKNVECLSNTCRVEIDVQNQMDIRRGLSTLTMRLADRFAGGKVDYVDELNGRHTAVLYMFRSLGNPGATTR